MHIHPLGDDDDEDDDDKGREDRFAASREIVSDLHVDSVGVSVLSEEISSSSADFSNACSVGSRGRRAERDDRMLKFEGWFSEGYSCKESPYVESP